VAVCGPQTLGAAEPGSRRAVEPQRNGGVRRV